MNMYKKAVRILRATVGITSNHRPHLPVLPFPLEVKSLHTDFKEVEEVSWDQGPFDGTISIEESRQRPELSRIGESLRFSGPLASLEAEATDLRFSFWGNQGLLYRFILSLLEKKHGIYNLHACALFDEDNNRLYVVMGGAGSGKTVYLLSGLERNLTLFSTETVHFQIKGSDVSWFKGSLADNVRLGNLIVNFPRFLPEGPAPATEKAWQKKMALDLSSYQTGSDILKNPDVFFILPHIEEGRKGFISDTISEHQKSGKSVFDNLSSKIAESFILYDHIPVLGFDEEELARRRFETANILVSHFSLRSTLSVLSNPNECWGPLLDQ
jgi:hypothetical protein